MVGGDQYYYSLAIYRNAEDQYFINTTALAYMMMKSHLPGQCTGFTLEQFKNFIETMILKRTGPYTTLNGAKGAIYDVAYSLDRVDELMVGN